MKNVQVLLLAGLGISLGSLWGCGSQKSVVARGGSAQGTQTLVSQAAFCSVDVSRNPALGVKLQSFQQPNGQVMDEWVRVKIFRLDNSLAAPNHELAFQVSKVNQNQLGTTQNVFFYWRFGSQYEGPYTTVTLGQLLNLARQKYNYPGQSIQEVILHGEFILHIPLEWVILTTRIQNTQVQALIPVFEANPKVYAQTRPAVLHPFHPLRHLINQDGDANFWQTQIQQFCF